MPTKGKTPKKTAKKLQLPDDPERALALIFGVPRKRLDKRLRDRPEDDRVRLRYVAHDAMTEALAHPKPVYFEEDFREQLKQGLGNPELAVLWAKSSEETREEIMQASKAKLADRGAMFLPGKAPDQSKVNRDEVHQSWFSRHGAHLEIHRPWECPVGVEGPGWMRWPGVMVDGPRVAIWPPLTPTKIVAAVSAMLTIDRELKAEANKFNLSAVGGENKARWDGGQSVAQAIRGICLREGLTCGKLLDRLRSGADGIQVGERENHGGQEEWFFSSQEEKRDPWAVKKSSFPAIVSRWRREAGTS
ncbi:MAG: hypothetical protein B7X11_03175 [Acidobacteria bacterium 37-65-4]|nr:MAG: hypothetical protein B7X11_03175 [Acidobacteria bacterium 37-65-4]